MGSVFLPSTIVADKSYKFIQYSSQENPKTKSYEGKDYRLYGKAELELVTKITRLFQFIASALLVPATLGIILALNSFRDLLNRKFQAISKNSVNVYVLEQLKESTISQPQTSPPKTPKQEEIQSSSTGELKKEPITSINKESDSRKNLISLESTLTEPAQSSENEDNSEELTTNEFKVETLENLFPDAEQMSSEAKEIQNFIQQRNFEDALRAMEKLRDYSERTKFVKIITGEFFKQNLIDQAIAVLDRFDPIVQGKEEYNEIRKEFASFYCKNGDYQTAKKCFNHEFSLRDEFFSKAAEEYMQNGQPDLVLEVIKTGCTSSLAEDFYKKLIDTYLEQMNYEKALEAAQYLFSLSPERKEVYERIANKCFENDSFEIALKAANKLDSLEEREFKRKVAERYLKLDWLEQTLEMVGQLALETGNSIRGKVVDRYLELQQVEKADQASKKLPLEDEKAKAVQIAGAYIKQGNFQAAINILKESRVDPSITTPVYEKGALTCGRLGKYEEAKMFIQVMPNINSENTIQAFFCHLAEEYCKSENYEKAEEVLSHLEFDKVQDEYIKIAEGYINQFHLDKALELLDKISNGKATQKVNLTGKIAEQYFKLNDLANAFKYAPNIEDNEILKSFYLEIAKKYHQQKEDNKALEVLREIVSHGGLVDRNSKNNAITYLQSNDYTNALRIIRHSGLNTRI